MENEEKESTGKKVAYRKIESGLISGVSVRNADPFKGQFDEIIDMNMNERMLLFQGLRQQIAAHYKVNAVYGKFLNTSRNVQNHSHVFLKDF